MGRPSILVLSLPISLLLYFFLIYLFLLHLFLSTLIKCWFLACDEFHQPFIFVVDQLWITTLHCKVFWSPKDSKETKLIY